jgi:Ca2+-binding EF-hand superfamily protein
MARVDTAAVIAALPTSRSEADVAKRAQMFKDFDPNGNGMLSLAEVEKGIRDVLKIDALFAVKPVVIRAFAAANAVGDANGQKSHAEYIKRREFRVLLVYLEKYFRMWEIFSATDSSGDRRLSREEFVANWSKLSQFAPGKSAEEAFALVDTNGGGVVLFDEFAEWALRATLAGGDLE